MAIGQLYDYRRHLETKPRRLAVLLSECPIHDLVELLHSQKIDIIYEQDKKFIAAKYNG